MDEKEKWIINWYIEHAHLDIAPITGDDGSVLEYRIAIQPHGKTVEGIAFNSKILAEQCAQECEVAHQRNPWQWPTVTVRPWKRLLPIGKQISKQQHDWLYDWLEKNSQGRTLVTWHDTINRGATKWNARYMACHTLLPKVYFRNLKIAGKYLFDFKYAFPPDDPLNKIELKPLDPPVNTADLK